MDIVEGDIHWAKRGDLELLVDGDRATGTWYLFQPCTYAEGNQAIWGSARYDEEYVRVDGRWMFKHLTLSSHFWTPFEKGGSHQGDIRAPRQRGVP